MTILTVQLCTLKRVVTPFPKRTYTYSSLILVYPYPYLSTETHSLGIVSIVAAQWLLILNYDIQPANTIPWGEHKPWACVLMSHCEWGSWNLSLTTKLLIFFIVYYVYDCFYVTLNLKQEPMDYVRPTEWRSLAVLIQISNSHWKTSIGCQDILVRWLALSSSSAL